MRASEAMACSKRLRGMGEREAPRGSTYSSTSRNTSPCHTACGSGGEMSTSPLRLCTWSTRSMVPEYASLFQSRQDENRRNESLTRVLCRYRARLPPARRSSKKPKCTKGSQRQGITDEGRFFARCEKERKTCTSKTSLNQPYTERKKIDKTSKEVYQYVLALLSSRAPSFRIRKSP